MRNLPGYQIQPRDWNASTRRWARKEKMMSAPRSDVIRFEEQRHRRELNINTNWTGSTHGHKELITPIIESYWDVFAEERLRNPILGFQFVVDTDTVKPIYCKLPRHGIWEAYHLHLIPY